MADDRYDDDYWAVARFWLQDRRNRIFGPPKGREFRPVADGPLSQNVNDYRDGYIDPDLRYDRSWEEQHNDQLRKLMGDSLLRRESVLGNPTSFVGQDPEHRDMMHPMDRPGPDPLR